MRSRVLLLVGSTLRQFGWRLLVGVPVAFAMTNASSVPAVGGVLWLQTRVAIVSPEPDPALVEAVAAHQDGIRGLLITVRLVPDADPAAWDAVITVPPDGLSAPVWDMHAASDDLPMWVLVDEIVGEARLARVFSAEERAAMGLQPPLAWPAGMRSVGRGMLGFFFFLWAWAFAHGGEASGTASSWGPLAFGVPRRDVWAADLVLTTLASSAMALTIWSPMVTSGVVLGMMHATTALGAMGLLVVAGWLGHALGTLGRGRWMRLALPVAGLLGVGLLFDGGGLVALGVTVGLLGLAYRSVPR